MLSLAPADGFQAAGVVWPTGQLGLSFSAPLSALATPSGTTAATTEKAAAPVPMRNILRVVLTPCPAGSARVHTPKARLSLQQRLWSDSQCKAAICPEPGQEPHRTGTLRPCGVPCVG